MKIKKTIWFFICMLVLSACHQTDKKEKTPDLISYQLSQKETNLLQQGDIILRHGFGFVSNSIVKALREDLPLSHVGMIVKNEQGEFSVIHSVSQTLSDYDGVQVQDIQSFVRDSQPSSVVVVRFKNTADSLIEGQRMATHAFRYLQKQVPFDYRFDLEDSTAFYCSELIVRILADTYDMNVGQQIFSNSAKPKDKLRLNVFRNPDFFVEIINHHQP